MPEALIIRTAAVFGGHRGQSFPEKILARAEEGLPLRVVTDQRVNPTYTKDLAVAALGLADRAVEGVVHVVSDDCCGWDVFAAAVLEEFQRPVAVQPIPSAELALAARRPRNGCLASTRVGPLRSWREALHEWAIDRKQRLGLADK